MYPNSANPEQTPSSALFENVTQKGRYSLNGLSRVAVVVVYFVFAFVAAFL